MRGRGRLRDRLGARLGVRLRLGVWLGDGLGARPGVGLGLRLRLKVRSSCCHSRSRASQRPSLSDGICGPTGCAISAAATSRIDAGSAVGGGAG